MSSNVNYGNVEVKLGDSTYKLKPTLTALMKIDEHFGSLRQAVVAVSSLSFSGIFTIITYGAGLTERGQEKLKNDLFHHGVIRATGPVSEFIGILMDPTGEKDEEDGDEASSEEGDDEGKE